MADVGDLFGSLGFSGGGILDIGLAILIGATALGILGGGVWWWIKKKKSWNIKVEFKIPRDIRTAVDDEGNERVKGTLSKEWGKGYYNSKTGVVFIKRPGKRAVPMKPFDVKRYLSGAKGILTVIQVGIEDYRPVVDSSYIELEDDETGELGALVHAKIDTSESRSWKANFEREAKSTYTMMGWLHQHGQLIGFGFIILCIIIGFAIVLGRV